MIAFAWKYRKLLSAIGVVLILMASLYWYGHTKYAEGYAAATVHWQEVVRVAQMKAREEREDVEKKVRKLSDPEIDAELASGNWLRRDEDY